MKTYLKNLIDEKAALDLEMRFEVNGPSGVNSIPLANLVEAILAAPAHEQKGIRAMLVKIDFRAGRVEDYFAHLAQAIAI